MLFRGLALLVVLPCSPALASSGIFQALLPINTHDGGTFSTPFYDLSTFNGTYLGTIDVSQLEYLRLGGGSVSTYKNSGSDVYGAQIYWRIYRSDALPGAYQSISIPFFDEYPAYGGNPGDQRWQQATSSVDIVHGLRDGNYTLEVWAQAPSSDGTHYVNNCGCNQKATYDIVGSGIATTVVASSASVEDVETIAFQSESNIWYELQSAPAVTGTWTSANVRLRGNGGPMSFFDPAGYSTQKFYRVFILP